MGNYSLVCRSCGERCEGDAYRCPSCGGILNTEYPFDRRDALCSALRNARQYWDYEPFFPIGRECEKVTMGEGFTPLVPAPGIARAFGIRQMSIKNEGLNPTGTFKDRCMSISISKAKALGASAVVIGSAGNAGAAAAAYAAPGGHPLLCHGAGVHPARTGRADPALRGARHPRARLGDRLHRPDRQGIPGARLAQRDDGERLQPLPGRFGEGDRLRDGEGLRLGGPRLALRPDRRRRNPVGHLQGLPRSLPAGARQKLPRMVGTQEEGCCAVVNAFRAGRKPAQIERVENPAGIAVAIADAYPLDGETALQAIYDSGGYSESVSSAEILEAQRLLGRTEGILCRGRQLDDAGGGKKAAGKGRRTGGDSVACVVTGSGLKDLQLAARHMPRPAEVEIDPEQLNRVVDGMEAAV